MLPHWSSHQSSKAGSKRQLICPKSHLWESTEPSVTPSLVLFLPGRFSLGASLALLAPDKIHSFLPQEQNETFILSGKRTGVFGSPDSHDPKGSDKVPLPTSNRRHLEGLLFPPWMERDKSRWLESVFWWRPQQANWFPISSGGETKLLGVLVSRG